MSKIKKYPAFWLKRHRTGGIDDHPQRYHINIGKRYTEGDFRQDTKMINAKGGDYRKSKHWLTKEKLLEGLPHGSGIDGDWHIEDMGSYFRADNSYHCMDEYGYYRGWQDFYLIIPKKDPTEFNLHFRGDQYLAQKYMLRDYLEQTISMSILDIVRVEKIRKMIDREKFGHYRIKGWRKLREDEDVWVNYESLSDVRLEVLPIDSNIGKETFYEVGVARKFIGELIPLRDVPLKRLRTFRTKEQALKFAKEWMKKHPNGV